MLAPNTVLQNRYKIIDQLNAGGMGAVYEARDLRIGSIVAVKQTRYGDDEFRRRFERDPQSQMKLRRAFEREAKLLGQLEHRALPKVSDYFEEHGEQFLVMKFIPGRDFEQLLEQGATFAIKDILGWADQLLDALEYLHKQEPPVIHRDIKPGNLKLTADGQIILLDFGLAKGAVWQDSKLKVDSSVLAHTPRYAPPEQINRRGTDERSDLFSLGATLYHLLTGETPADASQRMLAITLGEADPLTVANQVSTRVTSPIAAVLQQATMINHQQRFANATAMRRALREAAGETTRTILLPDPPPRAEILSGRFGFETITLSEKGRVKARRNGEAEQLVKEFDTGLKIEMVRIPGGAFMRGSPENEANRFSDEGPQQRVSVPTFYISKYLVTQAQWQEVAKWPRRSQELLSDPSHFKGSSNLPVEQVSWEDAVEFCERLSNAARKQYRLPSEAEWEYACRAGTKTPFAFGETITPEFVNYDGHYPYGAALKGDFRQKTTPVGAMGVANNFGLYDMHGNVWEWCLDVWHSNYKGAPDDGRDRQEGGDPNRRVLRGGSWLSNGRDCRSAYRAHSGLEERNSSIGFRVVLVAKT